jgi:signal transduction histidine kinase
MKGKSKTAAYITVGLGEVVLALLFFRERSLAAHQSAGASKPLMITWLSLFIIGLIGLILLCAKDLKRFFASQMEGWMIQGAAPTEPVPELEEAQRVRASGEPLDAIRLLREYLQAHPYELHVMSRIAEIYRHDLNNDLAAALEYEEMLKHKLPDDQWAWGALHLAKVYGRLNELEKSVALLERLDGKYAHTIAGRRAKKALEKVRDPDAQGMLDDEPDEAG